MYMDLKNNNKKSERQMKDQKKKLDVSHDSRGNEDAPESENSSVSAC